MRTWGLTVSDEEITRIRAVQHTQLNFITRHGRYLGEADVTRDEVIMLDIPRFNGLPSNVAYFQADGNGRLRFYGMVKNKRWEIAAKGVPSHRVTDFHDLAADRLKKIRDRKRKDG